MGRKRNPEINAGGNLGVEVGPPAPKKRLFIVKGYAIRPKTGGGRIPVLFACTDPDPGSAADRIQLKRDRIAEGREYKFEAMGEVLDWGQTDLNSQEVANFWIGHGCSTWNVGHVEEQFRLGR